tara:strand:+ start:653 stop:1162 length:510 start_codon:yes stop_codon:yes gene_type:complete
MATLIVETGSIVTGANTYVTIPEYITYAEGFGVTVEDTNVFRVQLIKAAQYIASKESQLMGDMVERYQPLSYPRNNLTDLDNFSWQNNEIPTLAKNCQMSLALDIQSGEDLYNLSQSGAVGVKSEEVMGAVKVEYAVADSQRIARHSRSQSLLAALMVRGGLGIPLVMG